MSMISNSVTHWQSHTNTAIANTGGNSAPISPETPHERRYAMLCSDVAAPCADVETPSGGSRCLHGERRYRRIE